MSTKKTVDVQTNTAKKGLSDNQRWVYGFMLLFFSLFVLLAVCSYYFFWADDQSLVYWGSIWSSGDKTVLNYGGKLGSVVSHYIVGEWFGVFGLAIPVVLMIISLRIMRFRPMFLSKSVRISIFIMIVGSVSLGYIFDSAWGVFGTGLGGAHGIFIARWLESLLGYFGTGLLLLALAILLAVYINKNTIKVVNRVGKGIVDKSVMVGGVVGRQAAELVAQSKESQPQGATESVTESVTEGATESATEAATRGKSPNQAEQSVPTAVAPNKRASDSIFEITDTRQKTEEPQGNGIFTVVDTTNGNDNQTIAPWDQPDKKPDQHVDTITVEDSEANEDFEIIDRTSTLSVGGVIESMPSGGMVSTSDDMEVVVAARKDVILDDDDIENTLYDPTKELSKYERPPVELLEDHSVEVRVTEEEIYEHKNRIIATLDNFGISIQKIKATIGPTVTLYEIIPAPGVRISKIKNLEDDIALSLSALGIRIIAPMPGKGTIGIEVPNKDKEIVSMYSVVKSMKFQESKFDLPIVLGKTIQNETFVIDLAKMPHLLVAGATGQGKSVGLNAVLTSLLYKKHPSELKFVLVDPKKVELTLYSKLERHFLAKMPGDDDAIITDTHKVINTLNSLCVEMDARYDLLRKAEVRQIKEYNEKFINRRLNPEKGHRYLPYIVVVIDEFADMIMTAGREIETPIARLAQLARAIGIHLVIATQRPTTNIITGLIKANFPTRIAFRVTSMIDSRTILDMPGANQLIGRGDMLVSTGSDVIRVQCAFVDTPEIERITEFIGNQRGYPMPYELPDYSPDGGDTSSGKNADMGQIDPMFEEVARFIVQNQQGSTSSVQRRFSIGYNRAGRIMDQIESAGIVGRAEGSKPREVLITDMSSLERLLTTL